MAGHLYVVIFEQGTVKIGMTLNDDPKVRLAAHRVTGERWGIAASKYISEEFPVAEILVLEEVLAGWCCRAAGNVFGREWFKFKSLEMATLAVEDALQKVRDRDLTILRKPYNDKYEVDKRFRTAMFYIRNGMPASQAAAVLKIPAVSILNRKAYKEWESKQFEKEIAK